MKTDDPMPNDPEARKFKGIYEQGSIRLERAVDWADGSQVAFRVEKVEAPATAQGLAGLGRVIVAGFGPPGRWVGEILERHNIDFAVIDLNPHTVEQQRKLGRTAYQGCVTDRAVLEAAGIKDASVFLLTIPDEVAAIEATRLARKMNPRLYIVARTMHTSAGMAARQAGADEVVKAEQAVARRFHELLVRKVRIGRA
jgi:voltage-gated potassium channel Kch